MKKYNRNNVLKEKKVKVKHQTLGDKIIILLSQRNDVTRQMLPDLLGTHLTTVDVSLGYLRKKGFKIFPIKGPGTPLRIAKSLTESAKYINWRRDKYLGVSKRMIVHEYEIGEAHKELFSKSSELLELLEAATKESNGI